MSLPGKTVRIRLMAIVLCLLAFAVYFTFAPAPSFAGSCTCGGGMNNQCQGRDKCICLSTNGVCTSCEWSTNDLNCKAIEIEEEGGN
ncbi:MAG: hypothetical protein QOD75_2192 [Blastocatellia bacterium]|nr:hypothetical protein [Blastocatellia bacterium]